MIAVLGPRNRNVGPKFQSGNSIMKTNLDIHNSYRRQGEDGRHCGRHRGRKGVVLVLVALSVFAIVGIMGLTFDLSRFYITKNEVQNFTDSGSIFAVKRVGWLDRGNHQSRNCRQASNSVRNKP